MTKFLSVVIAIAGAVFAPMFACAADAPTEAWPSRPVRLIITGGPASAPDLVGRTVAAKMTEVVGQSVVVDPLPAGGGIIGVQALTAKPADGHTLLLGTSTMLAVTPQLRKNLPYTAKEAKSGIPRTVEVGHPS